MAARRLVLVMLVLLLVSSLAAALAPVRPGDSTTSSSATTTSSTEPATPAAEGRLVRAVIDADAKRPGTVRAAPGDQLQLRVDSRRVATVDIPGLGTAESVAPLAPARFDLLLIDPGEFAVKLLESGRRIGTLEVSPRARPARPREATHDQRGGSAP